MLEQELLFFAAVLGLIIGSFLNVVVLRDKSRRSILTGRSACPHCHHTLTWYELIPVLSFVLQMGKCRSCKRPISWQYPVVELLTGLLTLFTVWFGLIYLESPLYAFCLTVAAWLLLVVSIIDLKTQMVSIEYVVAAGLLGGGGAIASNLLSWQSALLGMAAGAFALAFVIAVWWLATKEIGMGDGDLWIIGAIGFMVGYPSIWVALVTAVVTGAIVGVAYIALKGKKINAAIPFGPFLFVGALTALLWGECLIDWYTKYINGF